MQRVHDDAALVRADRDEVLAAIERQLADAHFPFHPVAHHRKRIAGRTAIRREVIRAIDVHRIDRGLIGKLHEVDHACRLRTDLLEVLFVDDHPLALFELVPLDDLGVRDFAVAVRAPLLLLNARAALTVKLVEGNRRSGFSRREHLDRNVHQADFQETLPGCASCHDVGSGLQASGFGAPYASSRSSWTPRSRPVPKKWIWCSPILSRSSRRAAP